MDMDTRMDTAQLQQALETTSPEFALMLMNIMNNRLRLTLALMRGAALPSGEDQDELRVFDKKMMDDIVSAFKARPAQGRMEGGESK